jgi:hypothetical protein
MAEATDSELEPSAAQESPARDPQERLSAQSPPDEVVESEGRDERDAAGQDLDEVTDETKTRPSPANAVGTVFISYRVDSDQSIAVAVKRLIKASLDPSPAVFVSGDGGLRPSSIGFKPQLQEAIHAARAFIGIITPSSKDREWIFFEAGAAWGRRQLYAPLLIDATPKDLGSSIADYQATSAADKGAMQRLLESIADEIGATLKSHFGKRYAAFLRVLEARRASDEGETDNGESDGPPEHTEFHRGIQLFLKGDREGGEEIFADLERSLDNAHPLRAEMAVLRIVTKDLTNSECAEQLDGCAESVRLSPAWKYWMALYEDVPAKSIEHLKACLAVEGPHRWRVSATEVLADELRNIGRATEAVIVLRRALAHSSRKYRSAAAVKLARGWQEGNAHLRLLVLTYGDASFQSVKAEDAIVDLAISQMWPAPAIYFGHKSANSKDSPSSNVARAYHVFEMPSLAYQIYRKAADTGEGGWAKPNLASLLGGYVVHAAGLEVWQSHVGAFSVSNQTFPYKVRADLESAIKEEYDKRDALQERGARLFGLLASIGEAAFRGEHGAKPLALLYRASAGDVPVQGSGDTYSGRIGKNPVMPPGTLTCPVPELPVWVFRAATPDDEKPATLLTAELGKQRVTGVFGQLADGALRGVVGNLGDGKEWPTYIELTPA